MTLGVFLRCGIIGTIAPYKHETKSGGGVGAASSGDAGRREDHENDRRIPMGVGDTVAAAREWGALSPSREC